MATHTIDKPEGTSGTRPEFQWRRVLSSSYLFLVMAGILVIGAAVSPFFLTGRNLLNIVTAASITSVLAIGQFFVIVTGGIDLSVGSLVALSTVLIAVLLDHHVPMALAVVAALAACSAAGLINGLVIVYGRITPFIATLAMLSIAEGISYMVQSGTLIQISNDPFVDFFSGTVASIPSPIIIFLAVMIVTYFVFNNTTFGRELYAIGGNREASRLSGLPLNRDLLATYTISGTLSGLAGLMLAAQLLQGSSLIGQGYELDAIAAVVVGGASLFGGTGDPVRAVIGGLIIAAILNIMNLVGIESQPQLVIKGAVILVAVFFSSGDGPRRLLSRLRGSGRQSRGVT